MWNCSSHLTNFHSSETGAQHSAKTGGSVFCLNLRLRGSINADRANISIDQIQFWRVKS
jgi:hypothetical protein